MNSRLFPAVICVLAMVLSAALACAQEAAESDPLEADGEVEPELTWDDYSVKGYAIEIFGGMFGGDKYLDLPVMGDRTYVEAESDWVMGYDGDWLEYDELDYTIYDGPVKTLENGYTIGLKIGSYLTDSFHVDLTGSYSASEATLVMTNTADPANIYTEEIDRDDSIQVFRGGITAIYDISQVDLFGIYPYVGFGFGGVITRFSNLEDVSGLYLVGTAGLKRSFGSGTSAFIQFDLTNFSMSRDELHYTKSVTFTDVVFGISFFVDKVPEDVRQLHEQEQEDAGRRH